MAEGIADMGAHVLAVAGAPVTHLARLLEGRSAFEWAINEKSALDTAVGISAAGGRACVVLKHNGLCTALDSLVNASAHTIGGGLVVVAGDDLDASSSTCLNDSRALACAARTPILEPIGRTDAPRIVQDATVLSERLGVPVLVRLTSAAHGHCGTGELPGGAGVLTKTGLGVDRDVAHGLTKLGRHQRQRLITLEAVRQEIDHGAYTDLSCARTCRDGVIAVGAATRHVAAGDGRCVLTLRVGWPLPAQVAEFVKWHPRVLVVEEPLPFTEGLVRALPTGPTRVRGRSSGHLPPEGALSTELVARAWDREPGGWTTIGRKPDRLPPIGRYDALYRAVSRLYTEGAFVAADVGSSVRLCYPPYTAADVALSLGSAVAVASGAARAGRRAVGVIGDYGLLHSGMESLAEAAARRVPVLAVVLANGVQAKTGGQPVPPVGLERLVRSLGIRRVDGWDDEAVPADAAHRRLRTLLHGDLPAVALVRDGRP
ncbi:thiamine pyrophosphate-dependent enzyme [Actinomadura chibensis]|uniref:thiamine pyrophosphate-dependent enzyme n=1 Tax=Actinomadura chibensis TaxID=392828 RepID=UPI0014715755|nr:thiamine pyrophosphate-dependent enzyme [Actinomadura chibensis]